MRGVNMEMFQTVTLLMSGLRSVGWPHSSQPQSVDLCRRHQPQPRGYLPSGHRGGLRDGASGGDAESQCEVERDPVE